VSNFKKVHFFRIFSAKNLDMRKNCSTFAPKFKKDYKNSANELQFGCKNTTKNRHTQIIWRKNADKIKFFNINKLKFKKSWERQ